MQIVTTWNKKASVVKNTDITITNYALIKQKKAKITCVCDFSFHLFFCFLFFFCLQLGADWEAISKTCASRFTGVSKHLKRIKALSRYGLGLSSVFSCVETPVKPSHSFLKYYVKCCLVKFAWLSSLSMHFPTLIYFNINNDITFIVTMKYTQHTCISCWDKFVYYMYHENFTS